MLVRNGKHILSEADSISHVCGDRIEFTEDGNRISITLKTVLRLYGIVNYELTSEQLNKIC